MVQQTDVGRLRNPTLASALVTMSEVMCGVSEPPTTSRLNGSRAIAR